LGAGGGHEIAWPHRFICCFYRRPAICERKTNRRVPSVYHGPSGTKREGLKSKGFLHCRTVHEFGENRTHILLKSLAIPAGIAPPRNFNGLRQVRHQNESTETKRFCNKCLTFFGARNASHARSKGGRGRSVFLIGSRRGPNRRSFDSALLSSGGASSPAPWCMPWGKKARPLASSRAGFRMNTSTSRARPRRGGGILGGTGGCRAGPLYQERL
jgi:hypothetical protein